MLMRQQNATHGHLLGLGFGEGVVDFEDEDAVLGDDADFDATAGEQVVELVFMFAAGFYPSRWFFTISRRTRAALASSP